jgi:hypothetical protein
MPWWSDAAPVLSASPAAFVVCGTHVVCAAGKIEEHASKQARGLSTRRQQCCLGNDVHMLNGLAMSQRRLCVCDSVLMESTWPGTCSLHTIL